MYQESSREAYNVAKPTMCESRGLVFEAIQALGVCNDNQIAKYLDWPINRVTPRRNELESLGLITSPYKAKNENGISVLMWMVAESLKVAA